MPRSTQWLRGMGLFLGISALLPAACSTNAPAPCPSIAGSWKIAAHCSAALVNQPITISQDACSFSVSQPYDAFTGTLAADGKLTLSGTANGTAVTCTGTATDSQVNMRCDPGSCAVAFGKDGSASLDMAAAVTKGTPSTKWNVGGTVTFPANETATGLKIVATSDILTYGSSVYASPVVPLTLTGSPPTAPFTLPIDINQITSQATAFSLSLLIFQDKNNNNVYDGPPELSRTADVTTGSAVWCDGARCSTLASFFHEQKGNLVINNDFKTCTIDATGWYYASGCGDYCCYRLISTQQNVLGGTKIQYSSMNSGAIVPR